MPRKRSKNRSIFDPETFVEARVMLQKGWIWFIKKYPAIAGPLSLWMLFGGAIFLYNWSAADKFEVKRAQPIGETIQLEPQNNNFSIMPTAHAAQPQDRTGVPIKWNGQLWGYEDTTFVAKVLQGDTRILVLDKKTGEVYEVSFYGTDYKQQIRQKK